MDTNYLSLYLFYRRLIANGLLKGVVYSGVEFSNLDCNKVQFNELNLFQTQKVFMKRINIDKTFNIFILLWN